jgi:hypothetical protein
MHKPSDYRAQAANCTRRAEAETNPKHRSILLQQAQTLERLADEAELASKSLLMSEAMDKAS